MIAPDLLQDEREFLHGRDDDLLAALDEVSQIAGMLGVTDRRAHLKKIFDRIVELVIENRAIGHDDDRLEHRLLFA